jgi:UDPglucose--hexose-1-phosphate uridylyltransferase
MSNLRKDPVTGRWVIIAESRDKRPIEFERVAARRVATRCPFCVGNEQDTPEAISDYTLPDVRNKSDWQVRVVPNKYPALNGRADVGHRIERTYETMQPVGSHEVIIESPKHCTSVTDLNRAEAHLVFCVYRDRLRQLSQTKPVAYALVFKNSGPAAGASLEHLHSQLIGTPFLPTDIAIELENAARFYQHNRVCLFCEILNREEREQERIVAKTTNYIAICPFASRFSHEVWILPRQHESRFETSTDQRLEELSGLVLETVARLEKALGRPAYNWLLHTNPFDINSDDHYHWHIEVFPRTAVVAGYELGSGCYINATPPERAAASLRSFDLAENS